MNKYQEEDEKEEEEEEEEIEEIEIKSCSPSIHHSGFRVVEAAGGAGADN